MKKLLILLTLLLAWTACAAAQEPALWPAYDEASGLWGYIDETGEWAIAPQFGYAGDFHGDCASAGTASPETGEQAQGVIDGNGAYLLQPEYLIQDYCSDEHHAAFGATEVFLVQQDGRTGWFNVENRYFSGTQWEGCWTKAGWPVMRISMDGLSGWADRMTGEIIVETISYDLRGDLYSEGYLTVNPQGPGKAQLLDLQGNEVRFPEGVHAVADAVMRSGLIAVQDEAGLIGYANAQGEIVIEPQYLYGMDFSGGFAEVQAADLKDLLIDAQGCVVMELEEGWGFHREVDGSAFVYATGSGPCLFNADGSVRLAIRKPDFCYAAWILEPAEPGAPLRLQAGLMGNSYFCLVDGSGQQISHWWDRPGMFDDSCRDTRGWQAVTKATGKPAWGYVDAWGRVQIDYQFSRAEDFRGALAMVWTEDGECGYIDRSGAIVRSWTLPE